MSDQENGHSKGALADVSAVVDIASFRARRGRGQVTYVRLSDDLVVGCQITNMETLIMQGRIPEPLVAVALEVANGAKGDAKFSTDQFRKTIELQDELCALLICEPPYKRMSEITDPNAVPEGYLCLADLSDEERGSIAQLVYGGLPELERFRERITRARAVPNGKDIRENAERTAEVLGAIAARESDARQGGVGSWSGD